MLVKRRQERAFHDDCETSKDLSLVALRSVSSARRHSVKDGRSRSYLFTDRDAPAGVTNQTAGRGSDALSSEPAQIRIFTPAS